MIQVTAKAGFMGTEHFLGALGLFCFAAIGFLLMFRRLKKPEEMEKKLDDVRNKLKESGNPNIKDVQK